MTTYGNVVAGMNRIVGEGSEVEKVRNRSTLKRWPNCKSSKVANLMI